MTFLRNWWQILTKLTGIGDFSLTVKLLNREPGNSSGWIGQISSDHRRLDSVVVKASWILDRAQSFGHDPLKITWCVGNSAGRDAKYYLVTEIWEISPSNPIRKHRTRGVFSNASRDFLVDNG